MSALRMVMDGLGVDSLTELRRLVAVAREHEGGIDRFTGKRYYEMRTVAGSTPIASVMVVAEAEGDIEERDEQIAANFAAMACRAIKRGET